MSKNSTSLGGDSERWCSPVRLKTKAAQRSASMVGSREKAQASRERQVVSMAISGEGWLIVFVLFSNNCLESSSSLALKRRHEEIKRLSDRLRLLGPDNVLARGYSITMDEKSGMIVRNAKAIKKGQRLCTRVVDGKFSSTVD